MSNWPKLILSQFVTRIDVTDDEDNHNDYNDDDDDVTGKSNYYFINKFKWKIFPTQVDTCMFSFD